MGGHLLECSVDSAAVKVDDIDRFVMALPGSPDFYSMDLSSPESKVREIE